MTKEMKDERSITLKKSFDILVSTKVAEIHKGRM